MKKLLCIVVVLCQAGMAQPKPGKKPSPLPKGYLGVLNLMPFGSTLTNVVVAEYTPKYSTPVAYDKLPTAGECTNQVIRYYFRAYNESNFKKHVDQYLKKNNLLQYVVNNSYLVYFFKEDSLVKISLRLYYNNDTFPVLLAKNLSVTYVANRTFIKNTDSYFVYEDQVNNKLVELTLGAKGTEGSCNGDWYSDR